MGKFDGFLLATDWDGTLFYKGTLPEKNIEAIRYFQRNGGLFTVCSGRFHHFLKGFSDIIDFNTYVSCCNGAFITNLKTDEILHQGFCDTRLYDILTLAFDMGAKIENIVFFVNGYDVNPTIHSKKDLDDIFDELVSKGIYKVYITHKNEQDALKNKETILALCEKYDYITIRSCAPGLEVTKAENSKGAAIRRIANEVGAKLVVTVGDYENDLSLIEAADIGYAVDNAIDSLKQIATRVTVNCTEGAIAKIIEDLDSEY